MRTYLTEAALAIIACFMFIVTMTSFTFAPTPANAGFFKDLGQFVATFGTAHEQNGYRDTQCDPAFQVQITNDAGDYLYSNNPTCPRVSGPSDDLTPTPVAVEPEEPEEEEPEEPTDPEEPPTDPEEPSCKGDCKA